MSRPIAFPHYTTLGDVFDEIKPDTHTPKLKGIVWTFTDYNFSTHRKHIASIRIGPYCSVRNADGYSSLQVRPRIEVVEHIKHNMFPAGASDSITFQLVYRPDKTVLVVANNSVIIGSCWLALIPVKGTLSPAINAAWLARK